MAVTLIATAGAVNANAYADETEADTYFDTRPHSTVWTSQLSVDEKKRHLIAFTRRLELLAYLGMPTTTTQALRWPRIYVPKRDVNVSVPIDMAYGQTYWPETVIPNGMKYALFEGALWLMTAETDPHTPNALDQFTSIGVQGVNLGIRSDAPSRDQMPTIVAQYLAEFRAPTSTRVVRA